jgi:probable rRNA maturation factor
MTFNHDISIIPSENNTGYTPKTDLFKEWVNSTLQNHIAQPISMSLCIVNDITIQEYNFQYRKKNQPTNVLSFRSDIPSEALEQLGLTHHPLGDVLLCESIINSEAHIQNKDPKAHWAHMIIHGTLHLLGYDHIEEKDAHIMEQYETELLEKFNFQNPYLHF